MIHDQSAALAAHARMQELYKDSIRTIGEPKKPVMVGRRRCFVKGKEYECIYEAAKAVGAHYCTVWYWVKTGKYGCRYVEGA